MICLRTEYESLLRTDVQGHCMYTCMYPQAIRILVSSSEVVSTHPLLVTVRQPLAISSWALPHVVSG